MEIGGKVVDEAVSKRDIRSLECTLLFSFFKVK